MAIERKSEQSCDLAQDIYPHDPLDPGSPQVEQATTQGIGNWVENI